MHRHSSPREEDYRPLAEAEEDRLVDQVLAEEIGHDARPDRLMVVFALEPRDMWLSLSRGLRLVMAP